MAVKDNKECKGLDLIALLFINNIILDL